MKYLFSITVKADSEAGAIEKFLDENISPDDMDIEIDERIWINSKPCVTFTVVGFYDDTNQKYFGHHTTETAQEAEKEAEKQGVTICGVIAGQHEAVDDGPMLH